VLGNSRRTPHARIDQTLDEISLRCLASIFIPLAAQAADDTPLTKEQIKQFLQTAEVIKSKPSSKGVTHPWRLTLSNGTITHDASFQPIDEHKSEMKLESGKVEFDFAVLNKHEWGFFRISSFTFQLSCA
jgi:hypothetical protein